ncbi:MAG: SpoIIE family protein phosphatase [Bacteroidetes bacterium]|nr:SpoIIE family protein phosphatase [Bacteroidota bacterium]
MSPLSSHAQLFKKKKTEGTETDNSSGKLPEAADDADDGPDQDHPKEKKGILRKVFGKKDKNGDSTLVADTTLLRRGGLARSVDKLFGGKEAEPIAQDAQAQRQLQSLRQYASRYEQSLEEGDYESALRYLQLYQGSQDSLVALKSQREAALREAEAQRAELADERLRTYSLAGGAGLLLLLAGVLLFLFIQKRKTNRALSEKNEALAAANAEIAEQQYKLRLSHDEMVESITYARRIQFAILPAMQHIHAAFADSFVFYRPKDIVSGDFFWFWQNEKRVMIAAVDCTGHGVPGAFMSVLGMSLLNQIAIEFPDEEPGVLLDNLHMGIINSLRQTETGALQQDGMDISLIIWEKGTRQISYAGAHNPLYMVSADGLTEIKGDKSPIGGARYASHTFTSHSLAVPQGATLYLFSDGFPDQFGGPDTRKFTYKRLREMLVKLQPQSLSAIGTQLDYALQDWKGHHEQLDDVLVIGIRL